MSRSTAPSPPREWSRYGAWMRANAIDIAICVALFFTSYRIFYPFLNPDFESIRGPVTWSADEGIVLHHGLRIAQGEMLYRDFFDFQGFFGYLPFSIGYTLFTPSVSVGKKVMFVLMSLWVVVIYLTVKEVTRQRIAGIIMGLYFPLCVWPTWPFAYQHLIAELWSTAAVLFGIWGERKILPRGWLIAGALSGLAVWTSLPEGVPACFALMAACGAVRYARRDGWHFFGQFVAGAFGFTALYLVFLAVTGSLVAAYQAVIVWPFTHYAPINRTEYASDAQWMLSRWLGRGKVQAQAAQLMVDMTVKSPKAGIAVATGVALLLIHRMLHRFYAKRPKRDVIIPWDTFAPCVYIASLGAIGVPVLMGTVRTDLAHIGFVQMACVLALVPLWTPASTFRRRWWSGKWRGVTAVQLLSAAAVVFAIYRAGQFHQKNVNAAKWKDIDYYLSHQGAEYIDRHCDTLNARIQPGDTLALLSHGGWTHVMCGTRSALSMPSLLHEQTYWGTQWKQAAREIKERKPRFILVPAAHDFDTLAQHEPALRDMYIGYWRNYMLKEGRPGPPFEPSEWWYSIEDATGRLVREGPIKFVKGPGAPMAPPYLAYVDDNPKGQWTYLDGKKLHVYFGDREAWEVFILERSEADLRTMTGTYFAGVADGKRMKVVRR